MQIAYKSGGLLSPETVVDGLSVVIGRSNHGEPLFVFMEVEGAQFLSVKGEEEFDKMVAEYALDEDYKSRTVPDK